MSCYITCDTYLLSFSLYERLYMIIIFHCLEIERRLKGCTFPVLICPSHIPELLELRLTDKGLLVGGSVTLSDLKDYITDTLTKQPPHTTGVLQSLLNMLKWFAGPQIRNVSVSDQDNYNE